MQKSIPFLSIDSIKSLFGDWLHWKPPSALDYSCTVPISFFTVQRYGRLFYYAARCKAWSLNVRARPFLRIILCTDSRTSIWVLGIALPSTDKPYQSCRSPFKISFLPIKMGMHVWWNQEKKRKRETGLWSEATRPLSTPCLAACWW